MSSVPPYEEPERIYAGPQSEAAVHQPRAHRWPGGPSRQPPPPVGTPASAAGWGQPPGGYAQPIPADPAYQTTTAWPAGREPGYRDGPGPVVAGYRTPRMRRTGPGLATVAPALFASVVISAGVIVLFFGNLFIALGAPAGTPGRERLLQFLAPADLATAAALILAVALVVLQRQLPGAAPVPAPVVGPRGGRVRAIALFAGAVAAVVSLAALVRGIVYLTLPHLPGAVKIGHFIAHLAAVLVAAAAAWWALHHRW